VSLGLLDTTSRPPVPKLPAATKSVISTVLMAAGVAVGLTACGTADAPAGVPPGPADPGPSVATPGDNASAGNTPLPGTDQPQPPTSAPTGAANPGTGGALDACPVNGGTLQAALKASSSDIYARAGKPATLINPVCYRQYATASTAPDGKSQPSTILFGFDSASRAWRPLNLGSSEFCTGLVPADVAAHLPGCS
jgi:hypothetical protein